MSFSIAGVFGVALVVCGCTLATDPFEPTLIDPAEGGAGAPEQPDIVDPAPSSSGGAGGAPVSNDENEGIGDVPLDPVGPVDPTDAQGGGGPQAGAGGSGASVGGVGDADTPEDPAPDTGEPPPEPCTGSTFEGSCYEFVAERVAWSAAEEACVAWGGQLASVGSLEEDAFLAAWPVQLGVPAGDGTGIWLGATDALVDNQFSWADNTPLTFASWAANQPDNGVGIDCVEKRNDATALWYDRRCTDLNPYVCERGL